MFLENSRKRNGKSNYVDVSQGPLSESVITLEESSAT